MELLTVCEFQHLSKLSDASLLGMLENGELKIALGSTGELLIDITDFEPDILATRLPRAPAIVNGEEEQLLEETIAAVIVSQFESIIHDALLLASQWYMNDEETKL